MKFSRYPEYKDSGVEWLGEVPTHWSIAPLKRLLEFQNGADHKSVESDDGYPVYGSGGVFAHANTYMFDGESVLFGRKGTINRPVYVTGKFWTVDTMYWTRVKHGVCGKFCYYAATAIPFGRYSTNTALPSMTQAVLGAHPIALPSQQEQTAIAAFLDRETGKIDALVVEQGKLIALLKEKRQALISHAVTKGLNPDAPMKPSGIDWLGEVPAHWEVRRVGTIFREVTDAGNDDRPILSLSIHDGVSDRELDEAEMDRKVTRSDDRSKYKAVEPNDLTYNMMRAWQGGFGAVTVSGQVSPAYVVVRPTCDVRSAFVEQVLRTPQAVEEMRRHSHGVTDFRLRLYWEEFKNIPMALPPLSEQAQILATTAREADKFDVLASEASRAIALLKERRSALISAAVTGKIDVRGAPSIDHATEDTVA